MPPLIEAIEVSKSFGNVPVLAEVSAVVNPGEVLAVTGANGTGKTTLLRCLAGWDRFDGGEVLFDGGPWDPAAAEFRSAVASELGESGQFLDLTVHEHLEFVARAHGDTAPGEAVSEMLDEMALTSVSDRFPFTLSQGQRRRFALAACWIRPRRLLILDEPEQNLDTAGRARLVDRILTERHAGTAVIAAVHDPIVVAQIADWELELAMIDNEPTGSVC